MEEYCTSVDNTNQKNNLVQNQIGYTKNRQHGNNLQHSCTLNHLHQFFKYPVKFVSTVGRADSQAGILRAARLRGEGTLHPLLCPKGRPAGAGAAPGKSGCSLGSGSAGVGLGLPRGTGWSPLLACRGLAWGRRLRSFRR